MRCAYEMAMEPTMPHRHFHVLVKCVKANGIRLVERTENGKTGREFIHCIAEAVQEKCALVLGSADFFSILSDGSQARKTKSEKELVLIRTERNGIPVYIVASLLEMEKFGGGTADAIVKGINSLFEESGQYELSTEDYRAKLVSCTADGASVNTGKYRGVLTQLKSNRPWLLTIHCANHRIELAVKSSLSIPEFEAVEEFYKTNYQLLKNSGKIKSQVAECAGNLGIHYYPLPKIHGTRFVNHRRRGFKNLLETWPAYTLAYENVVADTQGATANTRAKVAGLLKKFKSYSFLCSVDVYLDLLEELAPTSMVFEADTLMPYEVASAVTRTIMQLREKEDEIGQEGEFLDSYVARYNITEQGVAKGEFVKAGHKKKKKENREYVTVEFQMDDFDRDRCLEKVRSIKKKVIPVVIATLKDRFSSYDDEIFSKMNWFDPAFWTSDKEFGIEDIQSLSRHFEEPLSLASFDTPRALKEWKSFKIFVRSHYSKLPEAKPLWQSVLCNRRQEFPNLCKLVSLIISISGSNSSVERTFSVVTNILSDKRLSMRHNTTNEALIIYGNDSLWSTEEREAILDRAVEIYLESKRRRKVGQPGKPAKRRRLDDEGSSVSDVSSVDMSSECSSDGEINSDFENDLSEITDTDGQDSEFE